MSSMSTIATRKPSRSRRIRSGSITARDKSLQQSQERIEDDQQRLEAHLEVVQQRYLTQFNALDSLMAQLNSTSSYLTQQLESISELGKS